MACLLVWQQLSAKDAHDVQRDGVAFGKKDQRRFDPVGACARFSRFPFSFLFTF